MPIRFDATLLLKHRMGPHRIVRWSLNEVFSKAGLDVALRAIGLTGASALRLGARPAH